MIRFSAGFVAGAVTLYAFLTWGMWSREKSASTRPLRLVS